MAAVRVIGVGNPVAADDGIGPAVIEELAKRPEAAGMQAVSVGADALGVVEYLDYEGDVIIVDAVHMGASAGKVSIFPAENAKVNIRADACSLHGIGLGHALELAAALKLPASVTIVGIEPHSVQPGEEMSKVVREAIGQAVETILDFAESLSEPNASGSPKGEVWNDQKGADN